MLNQQIGSILIIFLSFFNLNCSQSIKQIPMVPLTSEQKTTLLSSLSSIGRIGRVSAKSEVESHPSGIHSELLKDKTFLKSLQKSTCNIDTHYVQANSSSASSTNVYAGIKFPEGCPIQGQWYQATLLETISTPSTTSSSDIIDINYFIPEKELMSLNDIKELVLKGEILSTIKQSLGDFESQVTGTISGRAISEQNGWIQITISKEGSEKSNSKSASGQVTTTTTLAYNDFLAELKLTLQLKNHEWYPVFQLNGERINSTEYFKYMDSMNIAILASSNQF